MRAPRPVRSEWDPSREEVQRDVGMGSRRDGGERTEFTDSWTAAATGLGE